MKKSLNFRKRSQNVGFTLVELVIVIAIVIILSVVSVPIYRGYIEKAKYSEGYSLLGTILSAQKAYYSEYGVFLDRYHGSAGAKYFTSYEEVLGVDARGNKYFTWFSDGCCDIGSNGGKKYFRAYALKPADLRYNELTYIGLFYNVTTGSTFKDTNYSN